MINFLTLKQETDLYKFVRVDLSTKYNQPIDIEEAEIVTGLTGSETIEDALIIRFFPEDSNVTWVEDKISNDIHEYCYENNIRLSKSIVIERDVWLGKIRYGLVYTDGDCRW